MKKILLLSFLMWGGVSFAQEIPQQTTFQNKDLFDEDIFYPFKDMKIFHDKVLVPEMIQNVREQQQDTAAIMESAKTVRAIYNEKDSATLESFTQKKNIEYDVTDELLAKASEHPFEAFKEFIKTAKIVKYSDEDMKKMNTVDKKTVPRLIQMITESGPDIGANQVPVMYDNE